MTWQRYAPYNAARRRHVTRYNVAGRPPKYNALGVRAIPVVDEVEVDDAAEATAPHEQEHSPPVRGTLVEVTPLKQLIALAEGAGQVAALADAMMAASSTAAARSAVMVRRRASIGRERALSGPVE